MKRRKKEQGTRKRTMLVKLTLPKAASSKKYKLHCDWLKANPLAREFRSKHPDAFQSRLNFIKQYDKLELRFLLSSLMLKCSYEII